MSNEERNKKLIRWAGFKEVRKKEVYDIGYYTVWENASGYWLTRLPNFTDPEWGIALCFKWLVPEAREYIKDDQRFLMLLKNWAVSIFNGEDPALSLCKAIEKLIDKEVSND